MYLNLNLILYYIVSETGELGPSIESSSDQLASHADRGYHKLLDRRSGFSNGVIFVWIQDWATTEMSQSLIIWCDECQKPYWSFLLFIIFFIQK